MESFVTDSQVTEFVAMQTTLQSGKESGGSDSGTEGHRGGNTDSSKVQNRPIFSRKFNVKLRFLFVTVQFSKDTEVVEAKGRPRYAPVPTVGVCIGNTA